MVASQAIDPGPNPGQRKDFFILLVLVYIWISPFLFNLYINDLIEKIKKVAFEVLAYADDIAILCSCEKEINLLIDVVERWAEENKFIKKKSAIMYLFNSEIKWKKYLGFPIVKQYRYLVYK